MFGNIVMSQIVTLYTLNLRNVTSSFIAQNCKKNTLLIKILCNSNLKRKKEYTFIVSALAHLNDFVQNFPSFSDLISIYLIIWV